MTEFVIFLVDVALVVGMAVFALAAGASVSGSLAAGLYGLVTGTTLVLVPILAWEVARTDNAFLGLYLIALLALLFSVALTLQGLVRLRAEPGRRAAVAAASVAVVTGALALLMLVVRGPGAWATGSGQFGLDVIAVDVALGLAAYFAGRRLGGRAGVRRAGRPPNHRLIP